ncbi:GNAT family protein [Chitinispirillales bacterium ANBcel5]|uniref:GNAT family N-acetyltransferase n=1 Tax=Cellulosispirillum alkaliphilum TaxID=3039283 RepID=UPI002A58EC5C|nr:GNAT family protein [Chitinispirillales bacterium ANBcel5]
MEIRIRKFIEQDIPYKVKWINDCENNKYLHYDLPLREDKTLVWFNSIKNSTRRADYTITCNGEPAGLIGLLNIDKVNRKAEYYVTLGEKKFKGKGIATEASDLLIKESYNSFGLNKIYLYTEVDNTSAQKLFERIGFIREGLLREDLIKNGRKIDRFAYGLYIEEYISNRNNSNAN